MNLKLLTPTQVLVDTEVQKISVEMLDGFFTLLPKHIDFVDALKNGILSYTVNGKTSYAACNKGVLVKKGPQVCVSTSFAILGSNLADLKKMIVTTFREMEEGHKELNLSMARLELGLTKGLIALNKGGNNVGL